jgi:hypothetical protein
VVDVTNFSPKTDFQGSRENLHLVERWTRIGPKTLEYEVTIEKSTVWTQPWTVKQEFTTAVAPGRLRQMCEILGVAPAEMFGNQPKIDGEPIPQMTRWSYRTLIALNKIRSERVRRSIGKLVEEMASSQ